MPMRRKNSAAGSKRSPGPKSEEGYPSMEAAWFAENRKRQRRRNEIAKASRRKNRPKK